MRQNRTTAVPEGNCPVPQQDESGPDQPTLPDRYRMISELFDKSDRKLDELTDGIRAIKQRLVGLEQDARQPLLAMEAGVLSDTKSRERTGGAAAAVQAMHGDSCFANRVDSNPKRSTSFVDAFTGPLALHCPRDDALVGNGAATPE